MQWCKLSATQFCVRGSAEVSCIFLTDLKDVSWVWHKSWLVRFFFNFVWWLLNKEYSKYNQILPKIPVLKYGSIVLNLRTASSVLLPSTENRLISEFAFTLDSSFTKLKSPQGFRLSSLKSQLFQVFFAFTTILIHRVQSWQHFRGTGLLHLKTEIEIIVYPLLIEIIVYPLLIEISIPSIYNP